MKGRTQIHHPSLSTFLLCVQLAIAKNNIIKLQEENQQLRSENSLILLKAQQNLEVLIHIEVQKKKVLFVL